MPGTVLDASLVHDGKVSLVDMLVQGGLSKSKGEARRLIEQGGVSVGGEKVTDSGLTIDAEELRGGVKIRKGKKIFHKFSL